MRDVGEKGLGHHAGNAGSEGAADPATEPECLPAPVLDVVLPVAHAQADLESSLRRLHEYLTRSSLSSFRITVAGDSSTEPMLAVGRRVAAELPGIDVLVVPHAGRGEALRMAWLASDAAVLACTDVDPSTDPAALLPLVAPLISGHADLAIGRRVGAFSRIARGTASDLRCGVKAVRAEVVDRLLPSVEDDGCFFDREQLFLADGLRIHEAPLDGGGGSDSRLGIVRARADLAGLFRMPRGRISGPLRTADLRAWIGRHCLARGSSGPLTGVLSRLAVLATMGAASTVAYLGLFVPLRQVSSAQTANLAALLVTAVVNAALHRRSISGVRLRIGDGRARLQSLLVLALALTLTSGALTLLHGSVTLLHAATYAHTAATSRLVGAVEVAVLLVANGLATLLRVVLLSSSTVRGVGHGAASVPRPGTRRNARAPGAHRKGARRSGTPRSSLTRPGDEYRYPPGAKRPPSPCTAGPSAARPRSTARPPDGALPGSARRFWR